MPVGSLHTAAHALPCTRSQIGDPAQLDAIFVAIGGGGLIAGIGAFVKALHPHVKVGARGAQTRCWRLLPRALM